jgi:hypothetical protein
MSALAAALFMTTGRSLFVPYLSWTEPLLALNFSLAMFCACRWPKTLPFALGLFFATKQYTVFAVPAIFLLAGNEDRLAKFVKLVFIAGLVALGITLPLFLWNPNAFLHSVVMWQLIQPFRPDAISYVVAIYHANGNIPPPKWIPFVAVIPAIALALWKCPRTPAGFAAAVTLFDLVFFAFNKQAFTNYYYFVIVTACWAMAATEPLKVLPPRGAFEVIPATKPPPPNAG